MKWIEGVWMKVSRLLGRNKSRFAQAFTSLAVAAATVFGSHPSTQNLQYAPPFQSYGPCLCVSVNAFSIIGNRNP